MPPHPLLMSPQVAPAAAQTTASLAGVHCGSHLCSARLHVELAPHPPQLVVLANGPQPSHACPHS